MIIKRKLYTEYRELTPEEEGELYGTVALGVGGSLAAGKLGKRIAKSVATNSAGKKAVAEYRKGARELMNQRNIADKSAADKLAGFKEGSGKRLFGKGKAVKQAEEAYRYTVAKNKFTYDTALKKLRNKVTAAKNKRITRAGKLGKYGTIAAGLGLTALAAKSKLKKKEQENNNIR